jgi:phage terminase large subunit-like protein
MVRGIYYDPYQMASVAPDDAIKLAMNRAVAKETPRGWKITKEKQSHKIDIVVAMAMAAIAAVERGQNEPRLVTSE